VAYDEVKPTYYSVAGIETRLRNRQSGVRVSAFARYFPLLVSYRPIRKHTYSATQPVPGHMPGVKKNRGLVFAFQNHIAPRVRMSRAIHLLPLYAFMACTETTLSHRFDFTSQEDRKKTPEGCHKFQPPDQTRSIPVRCIKNIHKL
jgi:hypothetical protein